MSLLPYLHVAQIQFLKSLIFSSSLSSSSWSHLPCSLADLTCLEYPIHGVISVNIREMKNEWSDHGQTHLILIGFYQYILRLFCCIGREVSERTFHCQLILNTYWLFWSDTGCILNVEPIRFAVGLAVACERNQGVMDDSKVFGLNNWGSQHYQNGETQEGGLVK